MPLRSCSVKSQTCGLQAQTKRCGDCWELFPGHGTPWKCPLSCTASAQPHTRALISQVGLFSGASDASIEAPSAELVQQIQAQQLLLNLFEEHWATTAHGAVNAADAVLIVFRRFLEVDSATPTSLSYEMFISA